MPKLESSEIDNYEHDPAGLKRVLFYGSDGSVYKLLKTNSAGELVVTEFEATSVNVLKVGVIKTITETDGARTRTTTIDATDPNDKDITIVWS